MLRPNKPPHNIGEGYITATATRRDLRPSGRQNNKNKTMVYVLNRQGTALMPTQRNGRVGWLLRHGRAVVVRRSPFTVRLLYDTADGMQDVTLGVDAGTRHVGLSATTRTRELFSSEVSLRTDITELLSIRREQRRTRRHRLRHREARFDNRVRSKRKGWLAPSVENRVATHLKLISDVHRILPVSKVIIEVAAFDTQLLKNPQIQGDGYQSGEQMGFWNTREYVLWRDGHICQHCHGKSKDPVLNVHHIESRKTGGDAPGNLITLCETCHKAYHRGKIELNVKRGQSLRDAAVMGIMKWELYSRAKGIYGNVGLTYGYITKHVRITHGLDKSHSADARCISGNPTAEPCEQYIQRQTRRHNRQIHKANLLKGGRLKANQAPYRVKGYRLFDKIRYNGTECFVFGRRQSGWFTLRTIDGKLVTDSVSFRKLKFLSESERILITKKRRTAIPPIAEAVGFLAENS